MAGLKAKNTFKLNYKLKNIYQIVSGGLQKRNLSAIEIGFLISFLIIYFRIELLSKPYQGKKGSSSNVRMLKARTKEVLQLLASKLKKTYKVLEV